MTKLIFITHPAVVIDSTTPIDLWQLSELGLKEVESLAKMDFWQSVDVIYSSAEPKAAKVAKMVAERRNIALVPEYQKECLGEIRNRTFIEPAKFPKAVSDWYQHPTENPNGWESVVDAQRRITDCVSSLMSDNTNKTVAIIGHGGTGTLLMCHVKKVQPSFADDPQTTGCIAVYDWDLQKVLKGWEKY